MCLTIGQTIGGAVSIASKFAIGLSGWSLWNKLMSFLRWKLVPRYFLLLDTLSRIPDSIVLVDNLLTLWCRPRCPELPSLHTPRYHRRQY